MELLRQIAPASFFILASCLLPWMSSAYADAMPPTSGVISVATEPVTIKTTSIEGKVSMRSVGVGQPVYLNDEIKTGPNSKLQILLKDQTVFNIGPNSVMTIDKFVFDPTKGELSVGIQKGAFKFVSGKVSNSNPDAMKVKLPNATISVRGTGVAGNVAPDGASTVVLLHGVVDVAGSAGSSTLSKSGWGVQVAPGGVVGQPTVTPPEVVKNIMGAVAQTKSPVSTPVAANNPAKTTTTSVASNSSSSVATAPVGGQSTTADGAVKPTGTSASAASSSSSASNAAIFAMPNNEAAKDAAGIVATNSLQAMTNSSNASINSSISSPSSSAGMIGSSVNNYSTKMGATTSKTSLASTAIDTTPIKTAAVNSTLASGNLSYDASGVAIAIIPTSYVTYLNSLGISTDNLNLNTVDTNSELGQKLVKAKQEYEASQVLTSSNSNTSSDSGSSSSSDSSSSSSSTEPLTDPTLIDNYLNTNYASDLSPGNKFNGSLVLTEIASSLETLRANSSVNSALDFANYSTWRNSYSIPAGTAGTLTFGFSAPSTMTCVTSGNSCGTGASSTLNSHTVIFNFATNQISNAYNVSYSIGGTGSGVSAVTGSYSSTETAALSTLAASSSGSKVFYLPVNASHTLLKMLASITVPTLHSSGQHRSTGVFNAAIQKQVGTTNSLTMKTANYSATQDIK